MTPRPPEDPQVALDRCREEASALAYAVSHDLRQPLRTILHNLQFLERRAGDHLPPEHAQFLERALDATLHGQSMIEDLLTYSRLNTRAKSPESLAAGHLVDRVQRDLSDAIAATHATIDCQDLPTVVAEPRQLTLLLRHLLDNALKFRHPDRPPLIRITAETRDTHWRFTITDNGLGLPPDQWDRALKLFKQLHPVGDYPGNGCGLAICQKIVELHGGDLTLGEPPAEGTTIHFTIRRPADEAAFAAPPKVNIKRAGQ